MENPNRNSKKNKKEKIKIKENGVGCGRGGSKAGGISSAEFWNRQMLNQIDLDQYQSINHLFFKAQLRG